MRHPETTIRLSSFLGDAELEHARTEIGFMVLFSHGKRSAPALEFRLLGLLRESIPLIDALNELWMLSQEVA